MAPSDHALCLDAGAACTAIRNHHEDTLKGKTEHQNRHAPEHRKPRLHGFGYHNGPQAL